MVYEKVSETRELDYDVLHKDQLDSTLVLENVDLNKYPIQKNIIDSISFMN